VLRHLILILAGLLALGGTLFASPLAAQKINLSLNGDVADGADVFSEEFETQINSRLSKIEGSTQVSILLVTIESLEGADSAVVAKTIGKLVADSGRLNEHWIVFLLAPNEREFVASINIPKLPEGVKLDDLTEETQMRAMTEKMASLFEPTVTPHFKDSRWEDGMRAGVDAIEQNLISDSQNSPLVSKEDTQS
jgi:uncharacterized membrane protein YgcG